MTFPSQCLSRKRPDTATFLQGEKEKEEIDQEEEKEVSVLDRYETSKTQRQEKGRTESIKVFRVWQRLQLGFRFLLCLLSTHVTLGFTFLCFWLPSSANDNNKIIQTFWDFVSTGREMILGMGVHSCNNSTWESEAGVLL